MYYDDGTKLYRYGLKSGRLTINRGEVWGDKFYYTSDKGYKQSCWFQRGSQEEIDNVLYLVQRDDKFAISKLIKQQEEALARIKRTYDNKVKLIEDLKDRLTWEDPVE